MGEIKVGDVVARKSYGADVFFKVVELKSDGKENVATLKGLFYRIQADAPESDLIIQSDQRINEHNSRLDRLVERKYRDIVVSNTRGYPKKAFYRSTSKDETGKFSIPGKVLHIDGDSEYLDSCLEEYKKFGIEAIGKHVQEKEQPYNIIKLIKENRPDILVLTGHDSFIKSNTNYSDINNYRNSKYFVDAVKEVRKSYNELDGLVIFAGACQSMYQELLNAGANFASSPHRVLIHALDPVFVCQKIAFASINKVLDPLEVVGNTITGSKGIGGVQTRGKYRDGFPREPYIKST